MKILVPVKHVPDATGDRAFADDGTVDRVASDGLLSELDEYAVEQALRIADVGDDIEVVALTVGPDDAADAVRRALQMGCSAGIHVSDGSIHGSDAVATSAVLAAAIRTSEPDLVICGMASTDGSMGVIPAMIAERLGWPAATFGATLELSADAVSITRDADTATLTIQAPLPAVVSVTDQSGEARYPSMKGIWRPRRSGWRPGLSTTSESRRPRSDWRPRGPKFSTLHVGLPRGRAKSSQTTTDQEQMHWSSS
jgi:electron transfer flavoprotein beta subunit